MTLDPDDLETFLAVVREKSFGRAASRLLVSQPTVSERVARIERCVGEDLFVRGPRGVSLTASGERLRPYAERILGLMDEAVETVGFTGEPPAATRGCPLHVRVPGRAARRQRARAAKPYDPCPRRPL